MNPLKLAWEYLFSQQEQNEDDASSSSDRLGREIKGCIFALLTLFELVALSSYISIDTFNLIAGRFDHILNLAGIVGASLGEAFLGTAGAAGYSVLLLTAWLCFRAFQGKSLRDSLYPILGTVLGTILTSISLYLLFTERQPEASLLQGGWLGKYAGSFLKHYFNTTGALLLIGFGYLITILLTTGLSVVSATSRLFASDSNEEAEEEEETPVRVKKPKLKVIEEEPSEEEGDEEKPAAKKKPRAKKKTEAKAAPAAGADGDTLDTDSADGEDGEAGEPPVEGFQELVPFSGSYSLPSPRLLKHTDSGAKKLSRGEIKDNAKKLIEHLLSFQITGEVTAATQGPVLTTYEFKPSAGMKLSKIAALQDDLGIVMGTRELRIIAPIPGKTVVGIEVPRPQAETISLKDIISEKAFTDKKLKIPVAIGKATDGTAVCADLAAMPHLLVAGATGSGKSVFINTLITSFLYRLSPKELRLILVDPKMLELNVFDGLPHLITNVITNNNVAFNALSWAVEEMDRRYHLMAETGSKNIESYNSKKSGDAKLPFIVIVVDELADLMMSGGQMVEVCITRLAQKARAAGIHLVLATQRPSTDVVTGLIKANIPSRISFKVPSGIDSRTVLDAGGAEDLIGRGDSLMVQPAAPMRRLHGCFVSEEELQRVVKNAIGGKNHTKNYIQFSDKPPSKD